MLSELFDFVLNNYIKAKSEQPFAGNPLGECVRSTIPGILRLEKGASDAYVIKGSVGQGTWATVPWIAIMNKDITTTTQHGVYVVYLFSSDGSRFYLTLNQGCTDLISKYGSKKTHTILTETADKLRANLKIAPSHFTNPNGIKTGNSYYDSGCIAYVEYCKDSVPGDDVLLADLNAICGYYAKYVKERDRWTSGNSAGNKQPKWSKYEAAILLEAYIESRKNLQPESFFIQRVSKNLRQMAINQGIKIDEAYRSQAGITFQMKSMASAYTGITLVNPPSKLFSDVVDIYNNRPAEWGSLLRDAKEIASPDYSEGHNSRSLNTLDRAYFHAEKPEVKAETQRKYLRDDKEAFYRWLIDVKGLAENSSAVYVSAINRADTYAKANLNGARVLGCSREDAKSTFKRLFAESDFTAFHATHTQPFKLYYEFMGIESDLRPVTGPKNTNEIIDILDSNKVPYTCYSANYIFVKKEIISSSVLRKIRNCQLTISVTSFRNGNADCWRIRFNEKAACSVADQKASPVTSGDQHEVKCAGVNVSTAEGKPPRDERIVMVLRNHYEYGYNYNSPIELLRFRKNYESDTGKAYELEDDALKSAIKTAGFEYEGKIYILSDEFEARVKQIVLSEIEKGVKLFYISELYSKHEDWLFEERVVDQGMLLAYIKKLFPDLFFKQTHFYVGNSKINEMHAIEEEIKRVWGSGALQTYSELKQLLPYIPLDKIKYALSVNSTFVWNTAETYTRGDYFRISEQEINCIKEIVENACRENGSISFDDINFERVAAENYELSPSAIKDLVFSFLSDDYERNQQVITKKGEKQDTATAIIEYCRKCESCTISELEAVMKSVSGTVRLPVIIEAANISMIRISEEKFVSDSQVDFYVEQIDSALDNAIPGESIGMREISTFGSFPFCGYAWNLFLLESYCRRFSKKYKYMAIAANSRNAGSIVKKDCELDYHEIMALSVAKSDVELVEDEVFNYLIATGYLARRQYSDIDDLIERAEAIRERGN